VDDPFVGNPCPISMFVHDIAGSPVNHRDHPSLFSLPPHVADTLVVAPFLLDTLGNLLGAYEWFDRTDDLLHFINWVLLVSAYEAFHFRRTDRTDNAVLLGYGLGAIAIIWWEVLEWLIAETGAGGGLHLDYGDTIGDLVLSSTGGLVGGLVGRFLMARPVDVPARTDPDRPRRHNGRGATRAARDGNGP